MFRVITKVILALIAICYGALFLTWNSREITVIGLRLPGGDRLEQAMPQGLLLFGGLILGVLLMSIALWASCAAMKAQVNHLNALVERAKEKLKAQLDAIQALRKDNERLTAELARAASGAAGGGQTVPADAVAAEDDDEDYI